MTIVMNEEGNMMKLLLGWPERVEPGLFPTGDAGELTVASTGDELLGRLTGTEPFDWIAVHCGLFADSYPWEWLPEIRRAREYVPVCVVLSDKVYSSVYLDLMSELAAAFHIELLPAGLTLEGGLQAVRRTVLAEAPYAMERRQGKLITVMSSSSKDGATTTAVHTALRLARQPGLKVGLLDLNLKCPDIRSVLDIAGHTGNLLTVRPSCVRGRLNGEQLLEHCVRYKPAPSLQLLLGSSRRDTSTDVTLDQIDELLQAAREAFDVVIADVHTFPDNAATVGAVRQADERWLIAQPVYASFRTSWTEWFESVWRHCGLEPQHFCLLVNRSDMAGALPAQTVSAAMRVPLLGVLPNAGGGAGIRSSNEGIPLGMLEEAGAYQTAVDAVVQSLLVRFGSAGVEERMPPVKSRPVRRLMAAIFS